MRTGVEVDVPISRRLVEVEGDLSMIRYRPRTGDYEIGNRIYDLYDIKRRKSDAIKVKNRLKKRYKRVRILKRSDGYSVIIDSLSERKLKRVS